MLELIWFCVINNVRLAPVLEQLAVACHQPLQEEEEAIFPLFFSNVYTTDWVNRSECLFM